MIDALFSVGWRKGEMDFGVRGDLGALSLEEMNEFRKMVVVAIGVAEDMWRTQQERNTAEHIAEVANMLELE